MSTLDAHYRLDYYRRTPADTARELETDEHRGLTHSAAAERLSEHGANELQVGRQESWLTAYGRQFNDLMIMLLLGCALLSALSSGH